MLSTCGKFPTGARKDEICASPVQVQSLLETTGAYFNIPFFHRELYKCPKSQQLAVDTFKQNKHIYHKIASSMIEKDLSK